jgi:hypothetical protein
MSYIRLFIDLMYHGIRARMYVAAREYVRKYERSHPPVVVLGGGNEWQVQHHRQLRYEAHHCPDCGAKLQIVRPGSWQCPNSCESKDVPHTWASFDLEKKVTP